MKREYWLVLVLMVFCFTLFGYQIGAPSLFEEDEATIAAVSLEMVQTGDPVTMHYNYKPWFHKPPLYIWLAALCLKFFGFTEFAVRLPSLLFGLGTVWLIYLLGKTMFDKETALYALLMGAASLLLIILSRAGFVDTPLTFFITLAFYCYYRGFFRGKNLWLQLLFFVSCALAVLSKGPLGIILPFTAVFLHLILSRQIKPITENWIAILLGSALMLIVGLPWWVIETAIHGRPFIESLFGKFMFGIYATTFQAHSAPFYFYLLVILIGFFPWSFFFPYSAYAKKGNLLLWLWFGVVFILFSTAQTKIPGYILPLFPPLALLTAAAWPKNKTGKYLLTAGCSLVAVIILSAIFILVPIGEKYKPGKYLAREILKDKPANIKYYNYKTWLRSGLLFYLGQKIELLNEKKELLKVLNSKEPIICFMDPRDYAELKKELPLAVGAEGFELLYLKNFK